MSRDIPFREGFPFAQAWPPPRSNPQRIYGFGFDPVELAPGEFSLLEKRISTPFRVKHIHFIRGCLTKLAVHHIRLYRTSGDYEDQLLAGPVPAEIFDRPEEFALDTADIGQTLSFRVENVSKETIKVYLGVVGKLVE